MRLGFLRLFALLPFLTIAWSVAAIPLAKCPTSNTSIDSQSKLLHKVVLLGADGRESVDEYQNRKNRDLSEKDKVDYQKKFLATGVLTCGGALATAQLSGAGDVITTAAHNFFGDQCQAWMNDGRCFFETAGQRVELDMASVKASCPYPNQRLDWAVAKLKRPIRGVEPYNIPERDWALMPDTSVTQVSGVKNFRPNRQVQECSVRHVLQGPNYAATHDCDTEPSASGSGQFDSNFTLIAVHTGGRNPSGGEYKLPQSFNGLVPVSGQFLSELRRAVDSSRAAKPKSKPAQ